MNFLSFWPRIQKSVERESLKPDLGRAIRATFAVMGPLLLAMGGWIPFNVMFMAFAAQSVALVDVRGAYTLRLSLLLAMTTILAGSALLGGAVSANITAAIVAAGVVAALGGVWRHVMPDYGTSLAISSTLIFVVAVNSPPASSISGHYGLAALVGGLWGVLLQVANWPIRPQHPLRRAVSDSWLAVADLFAALGEADAARRNDRVRAAESVLRTTLDQTYAVLASGRNARKTPLRQQLDELNLSAARLATRVVALSTAIDAALADPALASLSAALDPVLTSLTNTSKSVAVVVVSRQPAHLATFEVRLRRLRHLLQIFEDAAPEQLGASGNATHLRTILRQINHHLPALQQLVRTTIDRADERAAFSLELFDLDTWTLRPLASALVLNRRIDPVLVKFTARVAVLTMLGVAVFKLWNIPHGYWLPLTMVIVLQPDYGSTRQRAAQRVLGTLSGSVAASLLLWLSLPPPALTFATAVTVFFFGFYVKRRYAVAVFFVTLMVVLLTEAHGPITLWFSAERLASTLAGGLLALIAALFFWPVWERDRLPPILARAITTNREFLQLIAERIAKGGVGYDETAIGRKRRAEAANSSVFSSLQRLMGDPRNQQDRLEETAALANGNQRVTRALTVLALQLSSTEMTSVPEFAKFATLAIATMDTLTSSVLAGAPAAALKAQARELRDLARGPLAADRSDPLARGVATQIPRIAMELVGMTFALDATEPATTSAPLSAESIAS